MGFLCWERGLWGWMVRWDLGLCHTLHILHNSLLSREIHLAWPHMQSNYHAIHWLIAQQI